MATESILYRMAKKQDDELFKDNFKNVWEAFSGFSKIYIHLLCSN